MRVRLEVVLLIISLAILGLFVIFSENSNKEVEKKVLNIYCMVSRTCPHCTNMKDDFEKYGVEFKEVKDWYRFVDFYSRLTGIRDLGVPKCIALINGTYYILIGYPSSPEMSKDGYYISKELEEKACNRVGGKAYRVNGTYMWCIRRKGENYIEVSGNRKFLEFLIRNCESGYCEEIEELEKYVVK